jgi:CO/xanthine dehydrogenase Mo-binding subunit
VASNLDDYKMLMINNTPKLTSLFIESNDAVGPFGAKGVGEPPNIEPPAAVANAIASATGVRITSLPMTAEKIALAQLERDR